MSREGGNNPVLSKPLQDNLILFTEPRPSAEPIELGTASGVLGFLTIELTVFGHDL